MSFSKMNPSAERLECDWDAANLQHLARHGLSAEEAEHVCWKADKRTQRIYFRRKE